MPVQIGVKDRVVSSTFLFIHTNYVSKEKYYMGKFSNTEEFIKKAKKVYGTKYDYSKVDYIGCRNKVEIICPIHGSFMQAPCTHLIGEECPKCGLIKQRKSKSAPFKYSVTKSGDYNRVTVPIEEISLYTTGGSITSLTSGHIKEHVFIMSKYLGRPINKDTEEIHHKNGIKTDNRIENLEIRTKYHGSGQTLEDRINDCIEFLKKYKPDALGV